MEQWVQTVAEPSSDIVVKPLQASQLKKRCSCGSAALRMTHFCRWPPDSGRSFSGQLRPEIFSSCVVLTWAELVALLPEWAVRCLKFNSLRSPLTGENQKNQQCLPTDGQRLFWMFTTWQPRTGCMCLNVCVCVLCLQCILHISVTTLFTQIIKRVMRGWTSPWSYSQTAFRCWLKQWMNEEMGQERWPKLTQNSWHTQLHSNKNNFLTN